jgi:hypothetical protein
VGSFDVIDMSKMLTEENTALEARHVWGLRLMVIPLISGSSHGVLKKWREEFSRKGLAQTDAHGGPLAKTLGKYKTITTNSVVVGSFERKMTMRRMP